MAPLLGLTTGTDTAATLADQPNFLDVWATDQVARLRESGLARQTQPLPLHGLNFSSNDYLGLSTDPRVVSALGSGSRVGSSGSPLVSGTFPEHLRCEELVAQICKRESALLFGSGYQANIGLFQALLSRHDTVVADRLVHASIIDGISLAGARLVRFDHNSIPALQACLAGLKSSQSSQGKVFVVSESIFSINGSFAPLREIARVCRECNVATIIDEAHAFGLFGEFGGGRVAEQGLESEISLITGSFAKATGTYGGFVACSAAVRDLLVHQSRALIYSTALPLPIVAATVKALDIVRAGTELREELQVRCNAFASTLADLIPDAEQHVSHIIPVRCSSSIEALDAAKRLATDGIVVYPMRPPTVPKGKECLRFSLTLHHSVEDIVLAARKVGELLGDR